MSFDGRIALGAWRAAHGPLRQRSFTPPRTHGHGVPSLARADARFQPRREGTPPAHAPRRMQKRRFIIMIASAALGCACTTDQASTQNFTETLTANTDGSCRSRDDAHIMMTNINRKPPRGCHDLLGLDQGPDGCDTYLMDTAVSLTSDGVPRPLPALRTCCYTFDFKDGSAPERCTPLTPATASSCPTAAQALSATAGVEGETTVLSGPTTYDTPARTVCDYQAQKQVQQSSSWPPAFD
jgi:hypothetical protein